jgi:hypothetical protein
LHWRHVQDLSHLVHGGKGEEVVVLLLCDEKSRDACALLVVVGVLVEQLLDLLVVLLGELEGRVLIVVFRVTMVRESREVSGADGGSS